MKVSCFKNILATVLILCIPGSSSASSLCVPCPPIGQLDATPLITCRTECDNYYSSLDDPALRICYSNCEDIHVADVMYACQDAYSLCRAYEDMFNDLKDLFDDLYDSYNDVGSDITPPEGSAAASDDNLHEQDDSLNDPDDAMNGSGDSY